MNQKLYDSLMKFNKRSYPEYAFPEQYPGGQEAYENVIYYPRLDVIKDVDARREHRELESLQSIWDRSSGCMTCIDEGEACVVNGDRWKGVKKTACQFCHNTRTRCWAVGEEPYYSLHFPEKAKGALGAAQRKAQDEQMQVGGKTTTRRDGQIEIDCEDVELYRQLESLQCFWDRSSGCITCRDGGKAECVVKGDRWRGTKKTACEFCHNTKTGCWAEGEKELHALHFREKAKGVHCAIRSRKEQNERQLETMSKEESSDHNMDMHYHCESPVSELAAEMNELMRTTS